MMMEPLYKIAQQHQQLARLDDLDPQTLTDTLEGLQGDFQQKAVSVSIARRIALDHVDMVKGEIARLTAIKRSLEAREVAIKKYLIDNMMLAETKVIDDVTHGARLMDGRKGCEVTNLTDLPDQYKKVEVVITPKKAEILKALKAGEAIAGAHIVTGDPYLKWK